MRIYYVAVDYEGWTVFQTDDVSIVYHLSEPFYYSTTCRDNARKMCEILRKRNIY